jgi:NUDIX domain
MPIEEKYYNKKYQSTVFTIIGLAAILLDLLYLKTQLKGTPFEWVDTLILLVGGIFLTIGITAIISPYKFIKTEKKYKLLGIDNIFQDRDEQKSNLDIIDIIKNYNDIDIIGIKHSDFLNRFVSIENAIEKTAKEFQLNIYFLSPSSEYRFLFEPNVYKRNKLDLGHEIKVSLINLMDKLEKNPSIKNKVKVYVYDCIPLGNIMNLDKSKIIFNHYLFYRKSTNSLWFELNKNKYGASIQDYIEFLKTDGHCFEVSGLAEANFINKEYLSELDRNGKNTGNILPRTEIHKSGIWHRSVHVWIMNDENKLLFQKRSKNVELEGGLWDISCAGHVSAGSDSLSTAISEVYEELGIICQKDELEFITTHYCPVISQINSTGYRYRYPEFCKLNS